MAKITGASLNKIYNRLNSAPEYHPMEADTYADWSLEAGDTVKVSRDGNDYSSPVHSTSLSWKKSQQMTLSSSGSEERESVSKQSQKKYSSGSSGLRGSQYLHYFVEDNYRGLKSGLELTTSSAALYVNNKYTQMSSGLKLSESSAHLYVNNRYKQMSSGLKLSESSAHLYVNNKYTQMTSGLKLSESSAHLYVNNKYTQMTSGLKLSESSAHLYVNDKYKELQAGIKISSSSAALYAYNRTTKASIVARINGAGGSEVYIEAGNILLAGSTTLSGSFTITSGYLEVKKSAEFNGSVKVLDDYLWANKISMMGTNPHIGFALDSYSITRDSLATTIKKAEVSGNTVTLTQYNGDTVTFSKAATPTLSGSWSNGTLTVTSSPAAQQNFKRTLSYDAGYKEGAWIGIPVNATWGSSGQYSESTGFTAWVQISNIFSNMSITRSRAGISNVGADIFYGKLYYWNAATSKYTAATDTDKYWYYSNTNKSGTTTIYY